MTSSRPPRSARERLLGGARDSPLSATFNVRHGPCAMWNMAGGREGHVESNLSGALSMTLPSLLCLRMTSLFAF